MKKFIVAISAIIAFAAVCAADSSNVVKVGGKYYVEDENGNLIKAPQSAIVEAPKRRPARAGKFGTPHPAAWHADFALTCHGSSMAPTICDGDIVCIRRQPEVEQGEIAAVRIGEEATLKHFHRQGETVMLLADNTAVCPPMVFAGPQLEEIQIEGRAVGFCRGL